MGLTAMLFVFFPSHFFLFFFRAHFLAVDVVCRPPSNFSSNNIASHRARDHHHAILPLSSVWCVLLCTACFRVSCVLVCVLPFIVFPAFCVLFSWEILLMSILTVRPSNRIKCFRRTVVCARGDCRTTKRRIHTAPPRLFSSNKSLRVFVLTGLLSRLALTPTLLYAGSLVLCCPRRQSPTFAFRHSRLGLFFPGIMSGSATPSSAGALTKPQTLPRSSRARKLAASSSSDKSVAARSSTLDRPSQSRDRSRSQENRRKSSKIPTISAKSPTNAAAARTSVSHLSPRSALAYQLNQNSNIGRSHARCSSLPDDSDDDADVVSRFTGVDSSTGVALSGVTAASPAAPTSAPGVSKKTSSTSSSRTSFFGGGPRRAKTRFPAPPDRKSRSKSSKREKISKNSGQVPVSSRSGSRRKGRRKGSLPNQSGMVSSKSRSLSSKSRKSYSKTLRGLKSFQKELRDAGTSFDSELVDATAYYLSGDLGDDSSSSSSSRSDTAKKPSFRQNLMSSIRQKARGGPALMRVFTASGGTSGGTVDTIVPSFDVVDEGSDDADVGDTTRTSVSSSTLPRRRSSHSRSRSHSQSSARSGAPSTLSRSRTNPRSQQASTSISSAESSESRAIAKPSPPLGASRRFSKGFSPLSPNVSRPRAFSGGDSGVEERTAGCMVSHNRTILVSPTFVLPPAHTISPNDDIQDQQPHTMPRRRNKPGGGTQKTGNSSISSAPSSSTSATTPRHTSPPFHPASLYQRRQLPPMPMLTKSMSASNGFGGIGIAYGEHRQSSFALRAENPKFALKAVSSEHSNISHHSSHARSHTVTLVSTTSRLRSSPTCSPSPPRSPRSADAFNRARALRRPKRAMKQHTAVMKSLSPTRGGRRVTSSDKSYSVSSREQQLTSAQSTGEVSRARSARSRSSSYTTLTRHRSLSQNALLSRRHGHKSSLTGNLRIAPLMRDSKRGQPRQRNCDHVRHSSQIIASACVPPPPPPIPAPPGGSAIELAMSSTDPLSAHRSSSAALQRLSRTRDRNREPTPTNSPGSVVPRPPSSRPPATLSPRPPSHPPPLGHARVSGGAKKTHNTLSRSKGAAAAGARRPPRPAGPPPKSDENSFDMNSTSVRVKKKSSTWLADIDWRSVDTTVQKSKLDDLLARSPTKPFKPPSSSSPQNPNRPSQTLPKSSKNTPKNSQGSSPLSTQSQPLPHGFTRTTAHGHRTAPTAHATRQKPDSTMDASSYILQLAAYEPREGNPGDQAASNVHRPREFSIDISDDDIPAAGDGGEHASKRKMSTPRKRMSAKIFDKRASISIPTRSSTARNSRSSQNSSHSSRSSSRSRNSSRGRKRSNSRTNTGGATRTGTDQHRRASSVTAPKQRRQLSRQHGGAGAGGNGRGASKRRSVAHARIGRKSSLEPPPSFSASGGNTRSTPNSPKSSSTSTTNSAHSSPRHTTKFLAHTISKIDASNVLSLASVPLFLILVYEQGFLCFHVYLVLMFYCLCFPASFPPFLWYLDLLALYFPQEATDIESCFRCR